MRDYNRDRQCRLIKACYKLDLLLVHLFYLCILKVLANLLKIIACTVQQRNTNISLFKRANIVSTISAYKSSVAAVFKTKENIFFLLQQYASIHYTYRRICFQPNQSQTFKIVYLVTHKSLVANTFASRGLVKLTEMLLTLR